jgi:hypothetical protein
MEKKKILSLLGIALLAIPTIIVLADTQQQYFAAYTIGTTASQTQQYMELTTKENDGYKYQNSNFTVSNMLADSGGDGSYCNFCKLVITGKKKGFLGIYSNLKNPVTVSTPKVGYYNATNYGNVGYGTFRHYIKNETHFSNSGTYRVNAQDF